MKLWTTVEKVFTEIEALKHLHLALNYVRINVFLPNEPDKTASAIVRHGSYLIDKDSSRKCSLLDSIRKFKKLFGVKMYFCKERLALFVIKCCKYLFIC